MKINYKKLGVLSIFSFIILWIFQDIITVNVPRWDDFHGILGPVDYMLGNHTFSEKLTSLFSQNSEHRVVVDRLILLIITLITGEANMKLLAMLGTILVLLICFLFYNSSKNRNLDATFLLPIPFIIFAPHYWEILQSLMVPFQVFSVLFFSLLSLYLLANKKPLKYIYIAVTFAVFSHGNGLINLPLIAFILLMQDRKKILFQWIGFSLLLIFIYFYGYQKPTWNPNISPLDNPIASFLYFFEFLGAASLCFINLSTAWTVSSLSKIVPTTFGLIIFILFWVYLFKKYPTKLSAKSLKETGKLISLDPFDTFIFSGILFFFGTGILMAISRTGFGIYSRYVINSQILICLVYLFIINYLRIKNIVKLILGIGILYWVFSYFNYWAPSLGMEDSALADAENWQKNRSWFAQYPEDPQQISNLNHLLDSPYKNGIYVFPKNQFDKIDNSIKDSSVVKLDFSNNNDLIVITNLLDKTRRITDVNAQYLLFLESKEKKFLIPFNYSKNGLTKAIKLKQYFNENLNLRFNIRCLPNGEFKAFVIKYDGENYIKQPSNLEFNNTNSGLKELLPAI